MPATPTRIAFVEQQFRSLAWTNPAVTTAYGKVARDTKDQPVATFFSNMTDVHAVLSERAALLGCHARAFHIRTGQLLDLQADLDMRQGLPGGHVISDELVVDMDGAIVSIDPYDTDAQQLTVAVWGTLGALGDGGTVTAATDTSDEPEGATGPAWVEALRAPTGDLPVLAADWKNGRYWLYDAEAAETDLFEQNTDWGSYSAGSAVPGSGLAGSNPILTAGAKTVVGDQCTVLFVAKFSAGNKYVSLEYTDLPDYVSQRYAQFCTAGFSSLVEIYETAQDVLVNLDNATTGSSQKMAATVGINHFAGSAKGQTPALTAEPETPAKPYTDIGIAVASGTYLELIAIYEMQPDSDLPTLSS